ncbi:purine-nucleoside phosphorylase [Spiroplasma syrphidicola EA-1]|uniref:Purine nucleoside phosphorylase n=1 Tax=Spiroplasma syrphidicola EA-1 TaxID=1276229 RepID=R4U6Q5_9MOLU|nr:purine-nucleoside phosphorylase [Spiroplasma syrphidicola]AGM26303.1 purine-nucleoside phosphorylase [Spiroplasma syrphidicola EA-1]
MEKVNQASKYLAKEISEPIDIAIILGSGLANLVNDMTVIKEIPFTNIPHFTASTVVGHESKLVYGTLLGKRVLALKGRFHYYEGHDIDQVVLPIRVLAKLKVKNLILTNACGGISDHLLPGTLMLIRDQISLFCPSPLRGANYDEFGPRFPDMTNIYHPELLAKAQEVATKLTIAVQTGVYGYFPGPMYETPAEIRAYELLGCDAVGMSTVPEAIVAKHAGMNILGLSLITNKAAGLGGNLSHDEVLMIAQQAETRTITFLKEIIKTVF